MLIFITSHINTVDESQREREKEREKKPAQRANNSDTVNIFA